MKIKITFFGILMFITLVVTHSYVSLAAFVAAFIHEIGHLIAARACGIRIKELKLDIFGAVMTPEQSISSYRSEAILAFAGPLFNILSVVFIALIGVDRGNVLSLFITASMFLGILNLLPIESFDGGRILYCLLASMISLDFANNICNVLSFLVALSLWIFSVYLLLRLGSSLSLFVFSYALICRILLSVKKID